MCADRYPTCMDAATRSFIESGPPQLPTLEGREEEVALACCVYRAQPGHARTTYSKPRNAAFKAITTNLLRA